MNLMYSTQKKKKSINGNPQNQILTRSYEFIKTYFLKFNLESDYHQLFLFFMTPINDSQLSDLELKLRSL